MAVAAIVMAGTHSHAETQDNSTQKQRRREILHLMTSGVYAHHKCQRYTVDLDKIKMIMKNSGLEEVMKSSKEDADFHWAYYRELEAGVAEEVCSELYRQYGKDGTTLKGIITKKF